MEFSESIMEKIVDKMEKEKMSTKKQKEYLKKLIVLYNKKYNELEELYINTSVSMLISGTGLGMLLFSDNGLLSTILIISGISSTVIKTLENKNKNNYLDEFEKIEEYRKELEEEQMVKKYKI